jgi:hypothetical protein
MSDEPRSLPIGQREIDEEIESALDFSRRTLPAPRGQMFSFDSPTIAVASEDDAPADPIVRLERKLDIAMRMVSTLQRQLDSIDSVLARAIHRME